MRRFLALLAFVLVLGAFMTPSANADDGSVDSDGVRNMTSVTDMTSYFHWAKNLINQFDDAMGMRRTEWVLVGHGESITAPGCEEQNASFDMLHCYSDHRTYVGVELMWQLYQFNWASTVIAMSHEDGHDLQDAAGLLGSDINGPTDTLQEEKQADCVSGVFAVWALPQVNANVLADAPGVLAGLKANSSPLPLPQRLHGTFDERSGAFQTGFFSRDLAACNSIGVKPII